MDGLPATCDQYQHLWLGTQASIIKFIARGQGANTCDSVAELRVCEHDVHAVAIHEQHSVGSSACSGNTSNVSRIPAQMMQFI